LEFKGRGVGKKKERRGLKSKLKKKVVKEG
jgi:hypothetical protein